jgi:hypothetical protein
MKVGRVAATRPTAAKATQLMWVGAASPPMNVGRKPAKVVVDLVNGWHPSSNLNPSNSHQAG